MKLTNYIRDAYIKAIMADVPTVDYNEQAEKMARDHIKRMFAKDFPKIKIEDVAQWLCRGSINLPGNLAAIYDVRISYDCLKATEVWGPLSEMAKEHDKQAAQRNALRSQLKSAAYSCTTSKQLRELLPEFDKYLPAEEEKTLRTLPAVANIMAEFSKAGWPKKAVKK